MIRTALGATTVLSIVNLGFGGKAKPKVSRIGMIIDCHWLSIIGMAKPKQIKEEVKTEKVKV